MSDGIYVALSGAIARSEQLDTVAYQPRRTSFRSVLATTPPRGDLPPLPAGEIRTVPVDRFHALARVGEGRFRQGTLQQTGAELDLALEGDGYFVLATPVGLRYTRDGHFQRDGSGYLAAPDGARLLGRRGPIRLPGRTVQVSVDGQVVVDGRTVDRLRLVRFPAGAGLVREGTNRFRCSQGGVPSPVRVRQGMLEQAAVSAVGELITLIDIQRSFDALQEAIRAYRDMDGQLNYVGRPG